MVKCQMLSSSNPWHELDTQEAWWSGHNFTLCVAMQGIWLDFQVFPKISRNMNTFMHSTRNEVTKQGDVG